MKQFFSNLFKKSAALVSCAVAASYNAFAQVSGEQVFNQVGSELKKTIIKGLNVVEIAIILAGGVALIIAYIRYTKEDKTSQDAMVKIAIGTAVAFAFCTVFKLLLNTIN